MKQPLLKVVLAFCIFSQYTFCAASASKSEKYTAHNKGKFYFYWEVTAKVTHAQTLTLPETGTTLPCMM
jgi:hypothetical protein